MGNHPYTTLIKVRKLLAVKIQKALYLVNDFAKIAKLLKLDCIETIFTMIYNKGHGYNILFLNVMKNILKKFCGLYSIFEAVKNQSYIKLEPSIYRSPFNPINPTRSEVPCGVGTETLILRAVGTLLC